MGGFFLRSRQEQIQEQTAGATAGAVSGKPVNLPPVSCTCFCHLLLFVKESFDTACRA